MTPPTRTTARQPSGTLEMKPPRKAKGGAKKKSKRAPLTAKTADLYELYHAAVQEPDADLDFLDRVYKGHVGALPSHIREDFCGTAYTASRWVERRSTNTALGVDLDPKPIAWGMKNLVSKLSEEQRSRLTILQDNVMGDRPMKAGPFDAILAFNFSYWILDTRPVLLEYFKRCRAALKRDGLFVLDFMGGSDVLVESAERSRKGGFTYIWDQERYDPLTGQMTCHIGFAFKDGTEIPRAFTYTWRMWTMPEIKDILTDAGFSSVDCYIEGEDKNGKGTGVYIKKKHAPADRCVLAYVVARL